MNERTGHGLGLLAGIGYAVVYGVGAELFGLSWGLLVVAVAGGWVIGSGVSYGAWAGLEHTRVRRLQVAAALIASAAWLLSLFVAYVVSQALIPQAATALLERVSLAGFVDYIGGTFDFVRLIHLLALALLASMAWRAAR